MKTLRLLLLLVLTPLLSKAASPSFNSFDTNWFTIQSFIISGNTNKIVSWPAVNTTYLNTNGYVLNINTGALAAAIGGGGGGASLLFNPNQFSTNGGQVSITNTVKLTNATTRSSHTVDVTGNTASPQFVATNSTGLFHGMYLDATSVSYTALHPSSTSGAFLTMAAGDQTSFALWTRSNNTPNLRFMRFKNEDDRTFLELLNDAFSQVSIPLSVSNAAPTGSINIGSDGTVHIGTGLGFGATRQVTAATNAVRVFSGTGTTVTITNNTGNGSLDYRIDASGGSQTPILQDVDYGGFSATNMGTLGVSNLNVGTLVTSNLFILNNPSEGYISGLPVKWTATNELVVGTGSAWIEADTNLVRFAGETAPVTGLPTNRWAYVYLEHTNGVSGIVVVTNAPNAPFFGTARSQLGAPTRRFLLSVRTDAGGGVRAFDFTPVDGSVVWTRDFADQTLLSTTTATNIVETLVNSSNAVPPTSTRFVSSFVNTSAAGNASYGSANFTLTTSQGGRQFAVNATRFFLTPVVTSTNQQWKYMYNVVPTTGLSSFVIGYTEER